MEDKVLDISCSLAEVCSSRGATIYSFGKLVGIHPNQLYAYTSGRKMPSFKIALYIAQKLECPVEEIWKLN